ncbi:MAG: SET domain-containing protein-lysine N-methyltransferase [Cetobacterium sp.]
MFALLSVFLCLDTNTTHAESTSTRMQDRYRLVIDDHINPNSEKKTIRVDGKPHLCLFATRSICPGEEITYNCADSEWPWRCTVWKPLQ